MSELATLLTAIAGLITAVGGATAVVITALRTSRKERVAAAEGGAKRGAGTLVAELAAMAEDGVVTPEELQQLADKLIEESDS